MRKMRKKAAVRPLSLKYVSLPARALATASSPLRCSSHRSLLELHACTPARAVTIASGTAVRSTSPMWKFIGKKQPSGVILIKSNETMEKLFIMSSKMGSRGVSKTTPSVVSTWSVRRAVFDQLSSIGGGQDTGDGRMG